MLCRCVDGRSYGRCSLKLVHVKGFQSQILLINSKNYLIKVDNGVRGLVIKDNYYVKNSSA